MLLLKSRNNTATYWLSNLVVIFTARRHGYLFTAIVILLHSYLSCTVYSSSRYVMSTKNDYRLIEEVIIPYQTSDSTVQNLLLTEIQKPKRLSCMVAFGAYSDVEKLVNVEYSVGPAFHIDFLWRVFEKKGFWMGLSYDFFRSSTGRGLPTSEDKEAKYISINLRYDVPTAGDNIIPYLTTGVGWGSSFYKENEPWWDPNAPYVDRNNGYTNSTFFGVGAEIMLTKLRNNTPRHATIVEMRSFIGESSGLGFSLNLGYRIMF